MSGDGSYAPKSPDLSSFFSSPARASAPALAPAHSPAAQALQAPTQAAGPAVPPSQRPLPHSPTRQQRVLEQPQSLHLQPPAPTAYYLSASPGGGHQPQQPPAQQQQQQQQPPPHLGQQTGTPTAYTPQTPLYYAPPGQIPGHLAQPAVLGYGVAPAQSPQFYSAPYGEARHPFPPQPQPPHAYPFAQGPLPPGPAFPPALSQPEPQTGLDSMPGTRRSAQAAPPQAFVDPSPVKTKFPTARIKRIMQADEEVGKVAQQTPIAVGKALELFMVALVTKSAEVARDKSSKRVTAQMLKQVVETDEQWDFLREIVGKVDNEEKAGKAGKLKAESDSEEEDLDVKKKGKAVRKKKG